MKLRRPPSWRMVYWLAALTIATGVSVAWTEKPAGLHGAPRANYQRQAERLHTLIAARTGLPLHEIPLD